MAIRAAPAWVPQLFGRRSCVLTRVSPWRFSLSNLLSHGLNVRVLNVGWYVGSEMRSAAMMYAGRPRPTAMLRPPASVPTTALRLVSTDCR